MMSLFTRYYFNNDVSDKTASVIFEDSKKRLWIGSFHGVLYQFDQKTEQLISHQPLEGDLKQGRIFRITEDSAGKLWIGIDGSLTSFNPDSQIFTHYQHDPENKNSLSHNKVHDIVIDTKGILWLATVGGGINRFDPESEQFTHYRHNPEDMHSLSSDAVMVLHEDEPGIFWAGTFGGGLNRFDSTTGKSVHYQPNQLPYSLNDNRIPWLFKDENKMLWIGTYSGGINMLNPFNEKFALYQNIPNNEQSLGNNEVWAISQDQNHNFWIS